MNLDELYRDVILDHSKRPRNRGALPGANRAARGDNPSCGDEIQVFLKVGAGGRIEDIRFAGSGCAISQASASMMTVKLKGRTVDEARGLIERVHTMFTGAGAAPDTAALGELAALHGVRQFPQRIKCATLSWHAASSALDQANTPVSTEEPGA